MLQSYTIYGERCSGTNYLENLININFDANVTWKYGWKHFFGFHNEALKNSDNTLFICIVRNDVDWMNSLYRELHQLPLQYKTSLTEESKLDEFLNKEFWSFNDNYNKDNKYTNEEILQRSADNEKLDDRNIYTGERYKNIYELRHTKIKWMLEDLPKKVKNYVFIRYEDLLNDFENTLIKIKNSGLKIKDNNKFPVNSKDYKNNRNIVYVKKDNVIPFEIIKSNPNFIPFYEEKLYGYKK